ncbi:MAG: phosphoglycerate kinase [Armatimonadota bacterium]
MNKATVKDINLSGKKVIVRADFNVPMKDGVITDDFRIRAALPTIKYLLDKNCAVILMSHLGRPKGKSVPEFKMDAVAEDLEKLLNKPVEKLDDCTGPDVEKACNDMNPGDVILLENLRFHPEEEKNDPEFAKKLASLAEVYVNDAFGTAHRAHASTEGITKYLPSVAGFLLEKELNYLSRATDRPAHPYVAILGGAKVSDKIGVIKNLLTKVNAILVGGGMAFTFLKAKGYEIGKSILDKDIDLAGELMDIAKRKDIDFKLPVDIVVSESPDGTKPYKTVPADRIQENEMGVDIGHKTVEEFAHVLKHAKLIVWNGPMGIFEVRPFAKGTEELAKVIASIDATSIIGGGDSAACIKQLGLEDKFTHISTGGGASLEFLEGLKLPGVAALMDKTAVVN